MDADERWQQYWLDNGEELIWNDWLQKYPEYTNSCFNDRNCSSAELTNERDTDLVTCQPCENTDSVRNEDEVSFSNKHDETTMLFVDSQTSCLDGKHCSQSVNCESHMETDKQSVDSGRKAVSMSDTETDNVDSLTADVLKQSDISDGQVIATEHTLDTVELSDVVCSWDSLWKQHCDDTKWYYYVWFMQWLQEEREMSQHCSYTSQPSGYVDDNAKHVAAETSCLPDVLSLSSYACNGYTATSQESLSVVGNLLNELLLSVVDHSADRNCPSHGNGQTDKRKNRMQRQHGLFGISDLLICGCDS